MILVPYGLLLITGGYDQEPFMQYLIVLADLSLIALLVFSFKPTSKVKLTIEVVSYFVLLLPLMRIFMSFPFDQFDYFLFIFPTLSFIVLFPLSIYIYRIETDLL